ncbi:MAG: hypothetical protein QMD50_01060 [Patescibacteria group bacterium]|nr:hypothetical protein [Patescibacteria group bacterium]
MNQKGFINITAVVAIIIAIGVAGYIYISRNNTFTGLPTQVFSSKQECEQKTNKICNLQLCDYKCPKDFQKGWYPTEKAVTIDIST